MANPILPNGVATTASSRPAVIVAALPPLIVERLLHLQTALVGETVTAMTGNETGHLLGAAGHVVDEERQNDVQAPCHEAEPSRPTRARPNDEYWLAVAAPVYRELADRTGRRPTETAFHAALTEALTADNVVTNGGAVLDGVCSVSLSTAKRIRAMVEAARGPEAIDQALAGGRRSSVAVRNPELSYSVGGVADAAAVFGEGAGASRQLDRD